MQLTVLGNGAGGPFQGRHYTAQILHVDNQPYLIDCGEGTQMQMHRYGIRFESIRQIFISHLHGDHIFGLVGLLAAYPPRKRSYKVEIFSPPGLRELVETSFRLSKIQAYFLLEFHEVDPTVSQKIFENRQLQVWTIPLNHGIECCGWLFREQARPDYICPGKTFAFCSDTAPSQIVADCVRGVDLLYHEATFIEEHLVEAGSSNHSTAAQAAEIARQAGVGRLLLGHFSGRYPTVAQHLAEARAIFTETYAAEEGQTMEI